MLFDDDDYRAALLAVGDALLIVALITVIVALTGGLD
jgi:hypothetical protein